MAAPPLPLKKNKKPLQQGTPTWRQHCLLSHVPPPCRSLPYYWNRSTNETTAVRTLIWVAAGGLVGQTVTG